MKFLLSITLALFAASLIHADGNQFSVLVPGYGNPASTDLWAQFVSTAQQDRNYGMAIILNPASGPGVTRDPNYLNAQNTGPLADLLATDALVYGYVSTRVAPGMDVLRPIQDVKEDIDGYLVDAALYAGFVQGIFFDEVSSQLDNVGYYQELRDHVEMLQPGSPVIGNPGQPILIPAVNTDFTELDFVATFDTMVTFENFGINYLNSFESAPHLEGLPHKKIAHIVHTQSLWQPEFLELAIQRGAGFIYFTDDNCDGDTCDPNENPYDEITTYWVQFTSDISDFNSGAGFFAIGNLNGDDTVDLLDVAPFVAQIASGEYRYQADINCDGAVNLLDVDPFIQVLAGD